MVRDGGSIGMDEEEFKVWFGDKRNWSMHTT